MYIFLKKTTAALRILIRVSMGISKTFKSHARRTKDSEQTLLDHRILVLCDETSDALTFSW